MSQVFGSSVKRREDPRLITEYSPLHRRHGRAEDGECGVFAESVRAREDQDTKHRESESPAWSDRRVHRQGH